MPVYRIARYVIDATVDLEAVNPDAALQALAGVVPVPEGVTFSHCVIEEVQDAPASAYREETSVDVFTRAEKP
jgi:hypothetical protein